MTQAATGAAKWRDRALRLARSVVLIYLVLCLVFSLLQNWLIFPGAATQGQKHAIVRPAMDEELVSLRTRDGDPIVALFGAALSPDGAALADAASRPTLVYFYGNGMCMADCAGEFRKFRRIGFNVLVPEFTGYGMSGGEPGEQGVYQTADAAFDHLLSRPDIDPRRIVPIGWSLGAAAAIHLAATRDCMGLITLSAFTSIHDMARRTLPIFPTSLILKHQFDNEHAMARVKCPVLIMHGRRDTIIPFEMSERLARAVKSSVRTIGYDTDHNDIYEIGGDELFGEIAGFVGSLR